MSEKNGVVTLVGAGPGAVDLITVRGLNAIKNADVIVYDKLISDEFLDINDNAEKIFAGKIGGGESVPQDEICEILYRHASLGKNVVRLKGGDPFVFGRGGEEILYLNERGIKTEYIPGISSSIAAPGLNNIPITHRKISRSFTVLTAHNLDRNSDHINWKALKDMGGTIVFLMGRRDRKEIAQNLIDVEFDEKTPAAIISSASMGDEKIINTDLISIVNEDFDVKSPAIIVVGDVCNVLKAWIKSW